MSFLWYKGFVNISMLTNLLRRGGFMFRLVTGSSKSGKTEYLRNYLSALAQSGEDRLLMLVPDQQSFETEKAFLDILGPQKAINVTVLGFSRLCDYVFEKTGYRSMTHANDSVKALIMSMALEDTSDVLKVYGDKALSPQLLTTMLDVRREFMKNSVTSDNIRCLSCDNNLLADKLHDVNLVMSAYEAILTSSFEDPDGELSVAWDLLAEHKLFADYIICLDSYLSFSQQELDVLRLLMQSSREFLVSLSDDGNKGEDSIFEVSRLTASRLRAMAKESGVSVGAPIVCDYKEYFANPTLSSLEQNVFRKNTQETISVSSEDISPLSLYCAKDIYDEADFVARNIRRLVMEENYRYSDFAVVCRSVSSYSGIMDATLSRYDIPYFMDTAGHIHSKPLIKFISACLQCVITSFSKDAVLAVLKTGLTLADPLDISLFENYVFTWNISGKAFLSEFTANPRGFADKFTTDDLYELTKVENLRKSLIEPLHKFREAIKDADVRTVCKEFYRLMLTLSVDKRIVKLCDELEEKGYHQLCEEQTRLWQVVIDTFDRTVMVAGDRKFTPKRLLELLCIQFSVQDMAFIPRAVDQVTVGDIERLRLTDKKVVFVIGAVDGEFPKSFSESGLFTASERSTLTDIGVLADTSVRTWVLKEQYLCYYALTSASDKLFVSYPASTLTGTPYIPSQMISEIKKVCPFIEETTFSDVSALDKVWGPKPSFAHYSSRIGSSDNLTKALEDYYSSDEMFESSSKAIKRAVARTPFTIKDKNNAERLFGRDLNMSASQVENYHLCRFQYFCNYGLRVRERRAATIDAMEYGSFVHYILENFIRKYNKEQLCALDSSALSDEIKTLMNDYAQLHFGGVSDKSERFLYLFGRVSASVNKLIKHLIDELAQSSFNPAAFELDIGNDIPAYELTLPTGQKVTIKGKVDRADILQKNGKVYIRIVDYKTGSKIFSLSDVMYGLNLQMLIYLSALTKNSKENFGTEIIPAGVLYMPATVPVINAAFSDSIEKIDKERNKKLRMNGIILGDLDVLEAMERNMSGVYIPVSSKGEKVSGTDNLASLEEFGAIFARIDKFIGEMALELSHGRVEAVPAKLGYDACEYCPYKSVCGHKDSDPTRGIYKLDRKEILKELGLKENDGEVEE